MVTTVQYFSYFVYRRLQFYVISTPHENLAFSYGNQHETQFSFLEAKQSGSRNYLEESIHPESSFSDIKE